MCCVCWMLCRQELLRCADHSFRRGSCVCWMLCRQGLLRCADHSFRRGCKGEKDKITVFSDLITDWCLDESHILIQHIFTSFFLPFCFNFFQPSVYLSHSFISAIYLDPTFYILFKLYTEVIQQLPVHIPSIYRLYCSYHSYNSIFRFVRLC